MVLKLKKIFKKLKKTIIITIIEMKEKMRTI
jgi:hypothetical protein